MAAPGFWELAVDVSPDLSEGLTNFVWELGALGVVEEERPDRAARLRAFFPGTASATGLEASVRAYLDGLRELGFQAVTGLSVAALADENWADAWRAYFTPRSVGRRLLIAPPWESRAPNGRTVITIDPGRAFGTGHHGSTLGCLVALESVIDRDRPPHMIDLGTGSGILAIAAARLGVRAVVAVDDDPDAVAAAVANVARNHVADRVRCVLADVARLEETAPAPLVVANLLSAAHRRLAARYERVLLPGGTLLLGGILDGEASDVASALGDRGFVPRESLSVEGWTALELRAPLHDRA